MSGDVVEGGCQHRGRTHVLFGNAAVRRDFGVSDQAGAGEVCRGDDQPPGDAAELEEHLRMEVARDLPPREVIALAGTPGEAGVRFSMSRSIKIPILRLPFARNATRVTSSKTIGAKLKVVSSAE